MPRPAQKRTAKVASSAPTPRPKQWIWEQLEKAKTPAQIKAVEAKAIELGYSADGLFRQEVAKRLREG